MILFNWCDYSLEYTLSTCYSNHMSGTLKQGDGLWRNNRLGVMFVNTAANWI
jgi:hypothetical protein